MKTDNELIAEFMGHRASLNKDGCYYIMYGSGRPAKTQVLHESLFKYNTSWDWLMPVVEKIDQMYHDEFPPNNEFIRKILDKIDPLFDKPYMDVIALPLATPLEEAYQAVVTFIKLTQTNQPPS